MNICVHTCPGRRGEAKPRVFFIGGHRLIVAAILDSWVAHPHCYYEVTCEDGRRFLLRFDTAREMWELAGVYAAAVRVPKVQVPAAAATPAVQPRRWWSALRRA